MLNIHSTSPTSGAPQLSALRGLLGLTGAAAAPLSGATLPPPTAIESEADEFAALVAEWISGDLTSPTTPQPVAETSAEAEYVRQALLTIGRPPSAPSSKAALQLIMARRARPTTARAWAEVEFERPAKKQRAMSLQAEDAGDGEEFLDGDFDFLPHFLDSSPTAAQLPSFDSWR
jgi:hypothetical protein